ncbi:MAG: HAMP domain-containing protein [Burkholderiaceae bacterium]|nr:HAMP domain-containing protein [Burkholderiaceae bacterium]
MFHTLRARLIAICVGITVVSLLALSVAIFVTVRHDTLASIDAHIGQLTQMYAADVAEWVRDKQRITSSMKIAAAQEDPRLFLQATKDAGGFDDIYIVYADNRPLFLHPLPAGYSGVQRAWYKQGIATDGPALTPAYVDATSGLLTISFVERFGPKDKPLGVFGSDMLLSSIAKMVAAIRPQESSFAFLVDEQGQLLAYHRPELELKPVSKVIAGMDVAQLRTLSQATHGGEVDVDGTTHLLYARKVSGTPWILGVAVERAQAMQPVGALLRIMAGMAVLCLVLAVSLMFSALARLLRRLDLVRDALQEIASGDGDLTRRMSVKGNDELTQIGTAFNQFADKITMVLSKIRSASESVHVATREIALGNQDLSQRTEQQASSLEETSAAMEQLTSTVQHNADNARHASELASTASQVAVHGGSVVNQVVQTMEAIYASSQRMGDIIGVIDGIAFQTNILALNAAVEAARAGEQGRGFAVVASEVRSLAHRSAQAAKEIKTLIDGSVGQIESGSKLVQDAGVTMEQVVTRVRQVTEIVAEISAASKEQSIGIAEIGNAVTLMDQATQQNAALVEQATAAACSLEQQSAQLEEAVATFKLESAGAGRALRLGPVEGV